MSSEFCSRALTFYLVSGSLSASSGQILGGRMAIGRNLTADHQPYEKGYYPAKMGLK